MLFVIRRKCNSLWDYIILPEAHNKLNFMINFKQIFFMFSFLQFVHKKTNLKLKVPYYESEVYIIFESKWKPKRIAQQ